MSPRMMDAIKHGIKEVGGKGFFCMRFTFFRDQIGAIENQAKKIYLRIARDSPKNPIKNSGSIGTPGWCSRLSIQFLAAAQIVISGS